MDLLRTTVKVPGKRPPRAISACGPSASINGLVKDVAGGTAPEGGGESGGGRRWPCLPWGGDTCVTALPLPAAGASPVGLSLPPEPGTKVTGKGERSLQRCASASSAKLSGSGECPVPVPIPVPSHLAGTEPGTTTEVAPLSPVAPREPGD